MPTVALGRHGYPKFGSLASQKKNQKLLKPLVHAPFRRFVDTAKQFHFDEFKSSRNMNVPLKGYESCSLGPSDFN